VRVIFRRRSGRSLGFSSAFSKRIISALDGTLPSLYSAATLILTRLTSSKVGEGIRIKFSIISLKASFALKLTATTAN
jgi:hypothetical protein